MLGNNLPLISLVSFHRLQSDLGWVSRSRGDLPDELTAWDDLDCFSIRWRHLLWLLIHTILQPRHAHVHITVLIGHRGSDKWFYEIKWNLFIGLFLIWTLFIHLLMGIKGSSIYCVQAFSPFSVYCTELLFAVTELLKTLWISYFYSYIWHNITDWHFSDE